MENALETPILSKAEIHDRILPEIVATDAVAGDDPLLAFTAEAPANPGGDESIWSSSDGLSNGELPKTSEPLPESWASLAEMDDTRSKIVRSESPSTRPRPQVKAQRPVREERSRLAFDIRYRMILAAAVIVAAAAGAAAMYLRPRPVVLPVPVSGTATFNSRPDGAEVIVDGLSVGRTPLKVTLSAGAHTVEFQNGDVRRSLPVTIEAGSSVSQYVELTSADPEPASREAIASAATPTPAPVPTPVPVPAPVPTAVTGPSAGWLSVHVPIEMQILENGRIVGITSADRLMLPSGKHELELVSKSFEFQAKRVIQINAGKVTELTVPVPTGLVSINALPWADVFIDGRPVGTTPISNLGWAIGEHEVTFRHPTLGERRSTVYIAAQTPGHVGVDFTK
jgi:hypothetical protein